MVPVATMICLDNSEWMRNGDYAPNRFEAQGRAFYNICDEKILSKPGNTLGVMTMAGKAPRVLVSPTKELWKVLVCMNDIRIGGEMDLARGLQIAQFALKHRQNKNHQQRIIVFAGSPVKYDQKTLEGIVTKLKENSVSLDVVDFGEDDDEKSEKLEALVAAVNNNGGSHIVHVPPGPMILSDVLMSSPIFTGDGDGGSGGVSGFDFGVDPNIDPEPALELRVSMEEERARQEAAAKRAAEDAAKQEKGGETSSSHDAIMAEPVSSSAFAADGKKRHALSYLESALPAEIRALSMDPAKTGGVAITDTGILDATAVDSDFALALQIPVEDISKKGPSVQNSEKKKGLYPNDLTKVLDDGSFVSTILNSLPGVDTNDPSLRELLASLQGKTEAEEKKDEDNTENKEESSPW